MAAGALLEEGFEGLRIQRAEREDRLLVAAYALCRFLADRDRIEELRYDRFVPHEVLQFDEWTAASPRLPSMHGLYEATRREWDRAKADEAVG